MVSSGGIIRPVVYVYVRKIPLQASEAGGGASGNGCWACEIGIEMKMKMEMKMEKKKMGDMFCVEEEDEEI